MIFLLVSQAIYNQLYKKLCWVELTIHQYAWHIDDLDIFQKPLL